MQKPTGRKITVAFAACASALLVAAALYASSCGENDLAHDAEAEAMSPTAAARENAEDSPPELAESSPEDSPADDVGEASNAIPPADGQDASSRPPSAQASAAPPDAQPRNNAGGDAASKPAPQEASQRKWVEDEAQVWIEDKAAWSEQVPVYGTEEVSVCNICGEDITGNTSAHGKAHMLAGEGSGHHSEVRQTVEGYRSVEHPAEGHWETQVIGGHWE
ncbi:hypothetical protein [Adlercreutzia sp. ZJ141]|uniref:hypothetical protein n=1 Tax=Adlercreutzia sp. ZJ141 TaxID=2709406 RepID=UPI0013EAA48A|nr:hypothetical protein [Adlercreutzia sp. ZJ141]